jgi:hypothetical protein
MTNMSLEGKRERETIPVSEKGENHKKHREHTPDKETIL